MNAKELLIANFEEVRRRSIKVWMSIPEDNLYEKPGIETMSCIEIVRHILKSENISHYNIVHKNKAENYESPLAGNPYTTIDNELKNAQPYREKFLKMINSFSLKDLEEIHINYKDKKLSCKLKEYLLNIACYESEYTNKLLAYLYRLNTAKNKTYN